MAHFVLHPRIISTLGIVTSNLSVDAPTGGGRVSENIHFDKHSSKTLSPFPPLFVSCADAIGIIEFDEDGDNNVDENDKVGKQNPNNDATNILLFDSIFEIKL